MTSGPGGSGTCEIDCPFMTDYTSQTPISEETLRVSFDGSLYKTDKDPSCFSRRRLSPEVARHEGRGEIYGCDRKNGSSCEPLVQPEG